MNDSTAKPTTATTVSTNNPLSPAWWRFWLPLAVVVIADQLSKAWVAASLVPGGFDSAQGKGVIEVIPGFFNLIHVFNTGAAWSMFSGYSSILGWAGIAAVVLILLFRKSFQLERPAFQWMLGLLCGGILGNVVDRFRFGHVVDFIDLHFGSYRYPTFNVADSAICIGVLLYILCTFRSTPSGKGK